MMASEFATLSVNGQDIKLPIIVGTEGEKAIDITALRKTTGCLTFDPGLMNTAVCRSSITYVNGEKGSAGLPTDILRMQYRSSLSVPEPRSSAAGTITARSSR